MGRVYIRIILHLINGKHEMALAVLDSTQEMEGEPGLKAAAALAVGRFELARPDYESDHSDWFSGSAPVELVPRDIDDAIDVALIMQRSGENDRAITLLNAALETMMPFKRNRGRDGYGFSDVRAYALLGQSEQALTALEACADLPYLTGWQDLKFMPHYDSIRADPRFSAALSRLSASADTERRRAVAEGLL